MKTDLQMSMTHTRLSDLVVLSIERQQTDELNEEDILDLFFSERQGRGKKK